MKRALLWTGTLGVVGLIASVPHSAEGFDTYGYRWRNATATIRLASVSFTAGSAASADAVAAFEAWNAVDRSTFLFDHGVTADTNSAFNHSDGVSAVAFASRMGSGVLGVAYAEDYRRQRHACDVLFPNRVSWAFQRRPSRREYHFFSIALHEFGHAVGLDHEDRWRAVMNSSASPGSVDPFTEDDKNGARSLYPGASRHRPTPPGHVPIGGKVDWRLATIDVQPRSAYPGDEVTVTYELINAGTETASRAPVRHYLLSTNAQVSANDRLLLEAPERNESYPPSASFKGGPWRVRIPSGVSAGAYHLGVMVDPRNVDDEQNETNNAASVPLTILGSGTSPTPGPTPGPTPTATVDWIVAPGLSLTPRVQVGQAVSITYRVKNVGTGDAAALPELRLYLSDNPTISDRDTVIGSELGRVQRTPPGDGYTGTQSVGIISLTPGTWYVGASVDPDNHDAELREDNNVVVASFEVVAAGAPAPPTTPPTTTAPPTTAPPTTPPTTTPPPGATPPAWPPGVTPPAWPPSTGPTPPTTPPARPPTPPTTTPRPPTTTPTPPRFGTRVTFFNWGEQRTSANTSWGAALTDIDRHLPRSYGSTYADNDRVTHGHETTHGINAHLRNTQNTTGRRANAFYVMNGQAALVVEPNIRKSAVARYVPQSLRGSRFGLYITGSTSWDDTPLYVFDEWVAYTNGGVVGVDRVRAGLWREGWRDAVAGQLEFTVYAMALAMAVEAGDPTYFQQYTQFKEFLAWNAKRAMDVYRAGAQMQSFRWQRQDDYYRAIGTSADAAALRQFVKRVFGAQWAQDVMGIR